MREANRSYPTVSTPAELVARVAFHPDDRLVQSSASVTVDRMHQTKDKRSVLEGRDFARS